ncbi:MAG TPA: hypothetical protein VFG73_11330 [Rhodanobacteraceae bacterium]|nr:hypothetical protein [Rhodanobacteraceae bacterium]
MALAMASPAAAQAGPAATAVTPRAAPSRTLQAWNMPPAQVSTWGLGDAAAQALNAPFWGMQEITGGDSVAHDMFGNAVAVSGATAVVGASSANVDGRTEQGAAYVYTRQNGVWTQTAKLVASDGTSEDYFGYAVAIDGDTIAVGAWDHNSDRVDGGVYIFTRTGGTWSQTAKLAPGDQGAAISSFGKAVALAGPSMVLVGAPDALTCDANNENCITGAVYVFQDDAGAWSQTQKFSANETVWADHFGTALAVSAGDTLLVGDPADDFNGFQAGAAYLFRLTNGLWGETQQLIPDSIEEHGAFGSAVALDGNMALVSAAGATVNGVTDSGTVYAFRQSDGTWSQVQKLQGLQAATGAGIAFGASLALSGKTALVGAPWDSLTANDEQGSAYLFTRTGCSWVQQQRLSLGASAHFEDNFGIAVALDGGDSALAGAWGRSVGGNTSQGAVYAFTDNDSLFADGFEDGCM